MRTALAAGIRQAIVAITAMKRAEAAIASGSAGRTSNSKDVTARDATVAPAMPVMMPAAVAKSPRRSTSVKMPVRVAPRARRMPISRVRYETACASTS